MKLSKPQIEVLRLLVIMPRDTSNDTAYGYVNATVANALIRRGLAENTTPGFRSGWVQRVRITDAGKAALATDGGGKP